MNVALGIGDRFHRQPRKTNYTAPSARALADLHRLCAYYKAPMPKLVFDPDTTEGFNWDAFYEIKLGVKEGYHRIQLVHEFCHLILKMQHWTPSKRYPSTKKFTSNSRDDEFSREIEKKVFGRATPIRR